MSDKIEPVKKFPNSPVKQKEYRVSYIQDGVPRKATVFAFNMKPVLSTFFTHFPMSTNVTAIQLVVGEATNRVVKNEFAPRSDNGHLYAKDMVEGVEYVFQASCHKVVLRDGVYHYTNLFGETFTGTPSPYSMVRPS